MLYVSNILFYLAYMMHYNLFDLNVVFDLFFTLRLMKNNLLNNKPDWALALFSFVEAGSSRFQQ